MAHRTKSVLGGFPKRENQARLRWDGYNELLQAERRTGSTLCSRSIASPYFYREPSGGDEAKCFITFGDPDRATADGRAK